jgi:hypothetical protein
VITVRKIIIGWILILGLSWMILPRVISAKALPPKIGAIKIFVSQNLKFSLEIKILGYPDRSPSECAFKEGDKVIWSKEIPRTPGIVDITDDGRYIAMVNYGWYDEGGYKSVSFYDRQGELIREIQFGNGNKESMIRIQKTGFSSNGKRYLITEESGKKNSYKVE